MTFAGTLARGWRLGHLSLLNLSLMHVITPVVDVPPLVEEYVRRDLLIEFAFPAPAVSSLFLRQTCACEFDAPAPAATCAVRPLLCGFASPSTWRRCLSTLSRCYTHGDLQRLPPVRAEDPRSSTAPMIRTVYEMPCCVCCDRFLLVLFALYVTFHAGFVSVRLETHGGLRE